MNEQMYNMSINLKIYFSNQNYFYLKVYRANDISNNLDYDLN